jgi:type I restriction enzyme S subunit
MRFIVSESMSGTSPNIQKITQTKILNYPFPTHLRIDAQRLIVAYLDTLQAEVNQLKTLQAESAVELDAMLPAILDRAFKGDL